MSDKEGKSTKFIEYMLSIIDQSLSELLSNTSKKLSNEDRIQLFIENNMNEFSRQDYMLYFKNISTATAIRDLKNAVNKGILIKEGDKKTTTYKRM